MLDKRLCQIEQVGSLHAHSAMGTSERIPPPAQEAACPFVVDQNADGTALFNQLQRRH